MIDEIKEEGSAVDFDKLFCVKSDGKTHFNFGILKVSQSFTSGIYYKGALKDAKDDQYKMFTSLNDLRNYKPTNLDKIKERKETSTNAEMLHNSRNKVIKTFEDKVFHLKINFQKKKSQICLTKDCQFG